VKRKKNYIHLKAIAFYLINRVSYHDLSCTFAKDV